MPSAKQVFSHVTSHPEFQKAQVVSCYLSMPSGEVDTSQLILSILEAGRLDYIVFYQRYDTSLARQNSFRPKSRPGARRNRHAESI